MEYLGFPSEFDPSRGTKEEYDRLQKELLAVFEPKNAETSMASSSSLSLKREASAADDHRENVFYNGKAVCIEGLTSEDEKMFEGLEGVLVVEDVKKDDAASKDEAKDGESEKRMGRVRLSVDGKIVQREFCREMIVPISKHDHILKGRGVMPDVVWNNLRWYKQFSVETVERKKDLMRLDGKQIKIVDTSRKDLNGQLAQCLAYNSSKGRYAVELKSGKKLALRPKNLEEADANGHAPKGFTRFVIISDTHGRHRRIPEGNIPKGDVLIHCGDFTNTGETDQIEDFVKWLKEDLKGFKSYVIIAGNHDTTLHPYYYRRVGRKRFHRGKEYSPDTARQLLTKDNDDVASPEIVYLEDSGAVVEGFLFWGSPWQPAFCDWAFNLERGEQCQRAWKKIPNETQILLTHGPALGRGDRASSGILTGCEDLLYTIVGRLKRLSLHCAGHIHEGYGVTRDARGVLYVNGSTCTHRYIPANPAIVVDLPTPSASDAAKNLEILEKHLRSLRGDPGCTPPKCPSFLRVL